MAHQAHAVQVMFVPPSPVHPHIYSNGHICLDILYDGEQALSFGAGTPILLPIPHSSSMCSQCGFLCKHVPCS